MDFIDQLQALATKIPKLCDVLQTEEATKNALVLPFISALGYDIFDPTEVVPEFIADVGIKKGEKVDYAVKKDGKIILLFECKHCGGDLNVHHASQLFRYFSVTDARIAVLTNGVVYRFFTDLEAPNKMDEKPFMEINMLDLQEPLVAELKKLTKPVFNLDEMLTAAGELKYTREIRHILAEQLTSPSEDFVRLFASRLQAGVLTPARRERFTDITRRGFHQFINERINERLKSAMSGGAGAAPLLTVETPPSPANDEAASGERKREDLVITTTEELEGFYIIKAILREVVEPARVVARDTQSYFGILLDDNNRKPICRLHFNRSQKYLGVIGESRAEERIPIVNLNDLYQHAERLKSVVSLYEKAPEATLDTDA